MTVVQKYADSAVNKIQSISSYEKIAIASLLTTITDQSILQNNIGNDIITFVDNQVGVLANAFVSMKGVYTSYDSIIEFVKTKGKSFIEYTRNDIETVYRLYQIKSKIKAFSSAVFSTSMYRLTSLNFNYIATLERLHNELFVPIITYYKDAGRAKDSDLVITYTSENVTSFKFYIKDIDPVIIVTDISQGRIFTNEKFYKLNVSNGNVVMILNK